jgi:endonuclease/exonuclease/phosphatase family metal-dependent hydrolase
MRSISLRSVVAPVLLLVAGCVVGAEREDEESTSSIGGTDQVRVMSRNVYLGADLTPAIGAPDLPSFVAGNGAVLRQVTATNFPVRAKGLAAEIAATKPDLIGLQEVALWRTGPVSLAPLQGGPKTANTVRYDFLALLLLELAKRGQPYVPVVVQVELDFEAPADENGVAGDGPVPVVNAELNARLTMRDVILVRLDTGLRIKNPVGAQFQTLLTLPVLGAPVVSARGWTRVDAQVRGGRWFRFVNTHLEAFDPPVLVPSIRSLQAAELVAPGGPASGDLPVILLGDLNSDDDTVGPGNEQAYQVLLDAGFIERSTDEPTCCINSFDLRGGTTADLVENIDHVMTNAPTSVRLIDSFLTGLKQVNGYWNADHAGVVSVVRVR